MHKYFWEKIDFLFIKNQNRPIKLLDLFSNFENKSGSGRLVFWVGWVCLKIAEVEAGRATLDGGACLLTRLVVGDLLTEVTW